MSEYYKKVKTYQVVYICDACRMGEMKPTDWPVLLTAPPQYWHLCDKCSALKTFREIYPRLEYRKFEG